MATHDPIVEALKDFSSCDVSDSLLKLKYPHGGFLPGLTMWSPQRQAGETKIVGPAYTVKYVRKDYAHAPKLEGHYIDNIPPGSVVFISAPPNTVNAVYGGLMSNRAQYSGAVGTVVDGRVRDLQEHRDLKFPIFARDVGTPSPYEVVKVSATNVPVTLADNNLEVTINAGDYIIGDLNGVVCLPKHLAQQAIELISSQVEADERIAREIQKGVSFVEASKVHRAGVKKPE